MPVALVQAARALRLRIVRHHTYSVIAPARCALWSAGRSADWSNTLDLRLFFTRIVNQMRCKFAQGVGWTPDSISRRTRTEPLPRIARQGDFFE